MVVAASAVGLGRVQLPRQRRRRRRRRRGRLWDDREGERATKERRGKKERQERDGARAPIPRPRRTSNPGWTWLLVYPSFSLSLSPFLSIVPVPLPARTRGRLKELSAYAFHTRFLRSILDRAESTEATVRDSIGGILRPVSSRLCTGASRCRGEAIVFSVAHLGCLDFFKPRIRRLCQRFCNSLLAI